MSQDPRQTPTTEPAAERDFLDQAKMIGALVAGAALIIFFFQNLQDVEVHFLWMDWEIDMIWALIASALLGAIGALLLATIRGRRARRVRTK